MSDGRKRLSGAAYKRKRKEKDVALARQRESILKFIPSEVKEEPCEEYGEFVCGTSEVTDVPFTSPSAGELTVPASTSETEATMHVFEEESATDASAVAPLVEDISDFDPSFLEDPGLWPVINSTLRDFLVQHGPKQVKMSMFPKDPKTGRRFHQSHYWRELPNGEKVERPWLMYSTSQNAVFCFCCKLFLSGDPLPLLCSSGAKDWKNLRRNLASHEDAPSHHRTFCSWKELEMRLRVKAARDVKNQEKIESETHHWKNVLQRLVDVVRLLATQNLAFRGDSDQLFAPNNGNFLQMVQLLGKYDSVLQEHLRRVTSHETHTHYLGKTIQNELIQLLAAQVKHKILAHLRAAKYYSVILDCTPDVSQTEHITLTVRFVTATESYGTEPGVVNVREHFLEFLDVNDRTGDGMTNMLLQKLEEMEIDVADMRGQSYDHGANTRGKNSGVQTRVGEINPRAFFVPCSAHSLNLVISDAASTCREALEFFDVIQSIYSFFTASAHRWQILKQHLGPSHLTVKALSATRWESSIEAVKALRNQIGKVDDAIGAVMEDGDKARVEGTGITRKICNFKFLCGLVLWHDILFEINIASKRLQAPNLDISGAVQQLDHAKSFLQDYRSNDGFENVLGNAEKLAEELDIGAAFPRVEEVRSRRRKRRFGCEVLEDPTKDPKQQFKGDFFYQVLDRAIQALEERFLQLKEHHNVFGLLYDIPKIRALAPEVLQQQCKELEKALSHGELHDIDVNYLQHELKTLSRYLPANSSPKAALEYIYRNNMNDLLPHVSVALRTLLTLPVTVASGERGSSKLQLIKSHLRSTVTQARLAGLSVISVEHEVAETLDLNEMVHVFAARHGKHQLVSTK